MFDNRLLKYFSEYSTKDGCLDLSRLGFELLPGKGDYSYFDFLHTPEGVFYTKCVSKPVADAEIFIAQIYNLLGLKNAIYLPAKLSEKSDKIMVISNDILGPNYIYAQEHLEKLMGKTGQFWSLDLPQRKIDNVVDFSQLITNEAMAQQILMRMADVSTRNYDRNTANYAYEVQDGLITGLALFDSGACAITPVNKDWQYHHDFAVDISLNDYYMILMARDNENIRDYISCEEMGKKIGSVDVLGTAKDIFQTTGYEIGQEFVDGTAKQMDYVANGLVCSNEELLKL